MPKNIAEESFCVSFNFEYGKKFSIRGLFHDILSKIFCLTMRKKIVYEPFSVSLCRVSKNFMH